MDNGATSWWSWHPIAAGLSVVLVFVALSPGSSAARNLTALQLPATPILDDFDGRGLEDPLYQWGNWAPTSIDGSGQTLEIANGGTTHNEGDGIEADSYRSADATGDVEAYATIRSSAENNSDMFLYINLQQTGTPGWDGYRARWFHWIAIDELYLEKVVDGVATSMLPPAQVDPAVGDTLLIRNNGGVIELWHYSAGTWVLRLSAPDSSFSGGRIGLGMNDDGGVWDDFGGSGTTTPPPTAPAVPATDVLDRFERANEDPLSQAGAWSETPLFGTGQTLEVLGNAAGQNEGEVVAADSFRTDQVIGDGEVHARIASVPNNNQWFFLYLHLQDAGTAGVDGYRAAWFHWIATDGLYLQKLTDGVATTIAGPLALDPAGGDTLLLRRFGLGLELWRNHGGTWTKLLSALDGDFSSGRLGLGMDDDDGRWDDFGGGAISAPPPPPPLPPASGPPPEQSHGICSGVGIHAAATSRCLSDPVNSLTGAFVTSTEDLSIPNTGVPFAWTRTYTSSASSSGRLGPGWSDSYATSLEIVPGGDVRLHGDEGQIVTYARQPDGSFAGAPGARSTLSTTETGYELVRKDQVVYGFDAQGRLVSLQDRNRQGLDLRYDASGQLESIEGASGRALVSSDPSGLVRRVSHGDRSVEYGYTSGRLTSVTDVRGKIWRYTYDTAGRLASAIDPLGRAQVTNVYGADGRVLSQTDALGKTTTFAWDGATETARATDPNGNVWADVYETGVLVERVDPLGHATGFEHDADLNATAVTSPAGETTTMTYDARSNLLVARAPGSLGAVAKTFVYNASNDPTRVADARGVLTTYGYDAAGNIESVVQDGKQVASYAYDSAGRVVGSTNANGSTTTFTYDTFGNVASETDALGNETTYSRDDAGRVLARIDPRGNEPGAAPEDFTWRWTYDSDGNVLTERDPLGAVTTHSYDDAGNELTVTDAKGRTTTFTYDAASRVVSERGADPDGSGPLPAPVTTYTYDAAGNRRTQTDVLGRTTTFAYDAANRLLSTTGPDPDGSGPLQSPVTTNAYDDDGNLTSSVEPRGNVPGANTAEFRTTFTDDAAGRMVSTTDPLGNATANTYDDVGSLVSVRDARGHATTTSYDAAGRVRDVTAPDGGTTSYTYDGEGNVLERTNANGGVTTYTYDALGRLIREALPDPDGPGAKGPAVTTHAYDANGNLASTVDANGNATATAGDGRTSFEYDAANRLVRVDYSDSTPDVSFAYDAVGNRVSMTDGSGTETRAYDALDRLTSVSRAGGAFTYGYDAVGNVARRTYPGGGTTVFVHDGLDRLTSATVGGQMTTYSYDVASNLVETALPASNGHVETRAYDRAGRLTEVASRRGATTLARSVAMLDAVGNPTEIVRSGALEQRQGFAYDVNDRIVSVCFSADGCPGAQDPFIRWTYDRVGNRLTEERGDVTTTYTYDAADRLTQAGANAYTYDENGNQLSAGARTFTYDLANRVRTVREKSTTTTYSYDGDGARLQASTGASSSKTTNVLWDVNHALPQIALERSGSGVALREYAYGASRLSMTSGSSTHYFHHDLLGSVINMTSATGSREWTWSYEPFGGSRTEQRARSAPTNPMRFAGEYLDPTGHYHLRARQLDPDTGRFLRPDPVVAAVGSPLTSAYVYAANRPTVMVDPSGETFEPSLDWRRFLETAVSQHPRFVPLPPDGAGRLPPRRHRLVHPIPLGYSASHGGVHPTGGIEHYRALDFFPGAGAPVLAVQDGQVYRFSGNNPQRGEVKFGIFGWSLYLRADSGSDYFYTHLGVRAVGLGRVRAGQVIGRVGRWVRPSGENKSHLHLGVYGGPVTIGTVSRAPRVRAR